MHDFDFDAMQKKRIAAGARHKVGGSRSRKCGLPSDHLTAKEKAALNGEPVVYDLGKPMSWENFQQMPLDLQQTYLDGLHGRFQAGVKTISRDVFGKSGPTLAAYASKRGLVTKPGKRCLNAEERKLWESWPEQDAVASAEEVEDEAPEVDEAPLEAPGEAPCAEPLRVAELAATFAGTFEPERFLKWVAMLPMPEGRVKIRVEVSAE